MECTYTVVLFSFFVNYHQRKSIDKLTYIVVRNLLAMPNLLAVLQVVNAEEVLSLIKAIICRLSLIKAYIANPIY